MILDIRHVTTYRYDVPVSASRCVVRLLPADGDGQRVLGARIDIVPRPASVVERIDGFGTRVATVEFAAAHSECSVTASSRVRVERAVPPATTPSWEAVRASAVAARGLGALSPAAFLYSGRLVRPYGPATAYAAASFPPGRAILEGARDLTVRIHRDFAYDPRSTGVSTAVSEAFESRGGVCQDFAHVMIAGLRGIGLPAAYVSGYIRTTPPPGRPRLVGADASHAWVSVWCGEDDGWIDVDPTNAILAGDDHVVIGRGRDYADVAPIDGVIVASGGQRLSVSVDVVPVPDGGEETGAPIR